MYWNIKNNALDSNKETKFLTLAVVFIIQFGIAAFVSFFIIDYIDLEYEMTNLPSYINESILQFIIATINFAIFFILVKKIDGLELKDIGIKFDLLLEGLFWTFTIWLISNLTIGVESIIEIGNVQWNNKIFNIKLIELISNYIKYIIAVGLMEEIIFRGYFLSQIYIKFNKKLRSNKISLILAIALSSIAFSLSHIPSRITDDIFGLYLLLSIIFLFIFDIFFAILYIRTGNIFLTAGIHGLVDYNISLFSSSLFGESILLLIFIYTFVLLIFWSN